MKLRGNRSNVLELLHMDRGTDIHGEANWRIFATFLSELAKYYTWGRTSHSDHALFSSWSLLDAK